MKIDTEYLEYMWPMRHFLITCGTINEKPNIIAVSFCMPVSKEPPLIACTIGKDAYSCRLIRDSGEFVVNVPSQDLKKEIYFCGFHSGADTDKFKETGLTPIPARSVSAPVIEECTAHMECRVIQEHETGDKILFAGQVIEAYADESLVKKEKEILFAKGEFPAKIYGGRFNIA